MTASTSINSAAHRDIVVIGASAGGVEALITIVAALPADLPAAVFAVVHVAAQTSVLPEILARKGPLPASHAVHGETFKPGHIYVAPPDNHLKLVDGAMEVIRGPKENGHRPAVDPLFRSAAKHYGARVIGIILTGALDCGVSGMLMLKSHGGVTVVQNPSEAFCPDMPLNALKHVSVDHIATVAEIAPLIARLCREPIAEGVSPVNPTFHDDKRSPSPLVCPECNGTLTESETGGLLDFACHVGHRYSLASMIAAQSDSLEAAMWASVRALEESATLAERLITRSSVDLSQRFAEKAHTMRQHASTIKDALLSGGNLSAADAKPSAESDAKRPL